MEIAENGELFQYLEHTERFEEQYARFFLKQFLKSNIS